jgi:hypothetical protein
VRRYVPETAKRSVTWAAKAHLARVRTARDGNAPSILGYLARVCGAG